nr:AP2/ERF domain-containing protein [Tanacetum cinerariifolium]
MEDFQDTFFTDFLNDTDEYIPYNDEVMSSLPVKDDSLLKELENLDCNNNDDHDHMMSQNSSDDHKEDDYDEESSDIGVIDFGFIDELGSSCNYSPFEIAQEIASDAIQEEVYGEGEEPLTIAEAMKRMKYERKYSASLYAFNGIPECLRLKLGLGGGVKSREKSKMQRTSLQGLNKKEDEELKKDVKGEDVISSTSNIIDGELSLWSSLDLPTICYVS